MKTTEFNALCRKLNGLYYDIFACIPCITDYVCTREEFLNAMEEAIEKKEPLEHFLEKKGKPLNPNTLI